MKTNLLAGILGILGTLVFFAAVISSVAAFQDGVYSPANCFVTELGLYTKGDGALSAFIFNIGLIVSGLALSAFMLIFGIQRNKSFYTATSFFGVLCGVSLSAQGIFCLNYGVYHYIMLVVFLASAFITCAFFIISELLFERKALAFVHSAIAFLAGTSAVLFAGFVFTGGMAEIFLEDSKEVGRLNLLPFAVIGWAAYALLFMLLFLISVSLIWGGSSKAEEKNKPDIKTGRNNTKYIEL
jgi:hypothetical protein